MSVTYRAVGWNRQKKLYDRALGLGIALYLLTFVGVGLLFHPGATIETLLIRAFGTCALLLLHLVLSIGPLARLDRRLLPLLYNRRHLGVATFLLGLVHGVFSLIQFHALGDVNPLVSLLTSNPRLGGLNQFPFQPLGLAALAILFVMAATSHDFWLSQFSAPWWKRLHMAVYGAYGLLVVHVALGVLQAETHPGYSLVLGLGVFWLLAVHLVAGWRERRLDRELDGPAEDGWASPCRVDELEPGRARIVSLGGERVAVFRHEGGISALSNVCQHQNGPLGEGLVIDACVVCPWHGYEYKLDSGRSPAPFSERVPTFNVKVVENAVWIDPVPNPAGTRVEPAPVPSAAPPPQGEFYVGYRESAPPALGRHLRRVVAGLMVAAVAIACALVAWQRPFAESVFEYGKISTFTGRLSEAPYPTLYPTETASEGAGPLLLVGLGKHGADAQVAGLGGRLVRLEGQRISRGEDRMLELTSTAVEDRGTATEVGTAFRSHGEQVLAGEIVDSKCHLGVMKPGEGKPHRACAARCISGGAPPMLWVRSGSGDEARYLMVGRDDRPLGREILDRVAEPVVVTGELVEVNGLWVLRTEPREIERLASLAD